MDHAKLSPSASERWINCAGSIEACKDIKDEGNEAAELGTGAHSLGERTLRAGYTAVDEKLIGKEIRFRYEKGQSTLTVTSEMVEHVNVYVGRVVEVLQSRRKSKLNLEKRVDLRFIRKGMFGHSDTIIDDAANHALVVSDFKYGFVPVVLVGNEDALLFGAFDEADINTQLLCYAAGALQEYLWLPEEVTLEIIQPRSMEVPPVQSVTLPTDYVWDWAMNVLKPAAAKADDPGSPRTPGHWCRFCPARFDCVELTQHVSNQAESDFTSIVAPGATLPNPSKLSKEQLINILQWIPLIDAWCRETTQHVFNRMMSGEKFPGHKLVRGRGSRFWPQENWQTTIEAFAEWFAAQGFTGMDVAELHKQILEPVQVKSPAQVEDLGPIFKKAVKMLAEKKAGGLTLAVESDRRKAVEPVSEFAELGIATDDSETD